VATLAPDVDDGGLLRRQPSGDRADPPFLLPARQARHGGLVAIGHRRRPPGITIWLQAEVAVLFIGAGILGILYYGSLFRGAKGPSGLLALASVAVGTSKEPTLGVLGQLGAFFL